MLDAHLAAKSPLHSSAYPEPRAVLTLLKPITWFPPMWAYGCGLVSCGVPLLPHLPAAIMGILLAGPLVCGTSQAVNDWFDRHVDAINEPNRPIPSGRVPGLWGLRIAQIWTVLSLLVAVSLGPSVLVAAMIGLALAWAYSAPPMRLKENGWWGNAAVGLCYEGLPWFTGAAALTSALPDARILLLALLYSLGAHGIMTLNDFKSIAGDTVMGVRSLPVQLGAERAARLACLVMLVPQAIVIALLYAWGAPLYAVAIGAFSLAQMLLMRRLLSDPRRFAPWYNGTGITLYVLGMLVSAFALRSLLAGGV